ncbi:hypothetical protein [Asticcacaulis solisilvae]|uniref:hypothetical protein n=1 Tax=Asticcacaulis solisilvae TaxID=1217274 RepID=UPI003FD8E0DF
MRKTAFIGLIVLAAVLFGCSQTPRPVAASSAETCRAQGGHESRSPFGAPLCQIPYSDGGKACTGKIDCQGRCLIDLDGQTVKTLKPGDAVTGKCEAEHATFGCYAIVEDGKMSGPGVCID